MFLGTFRVVLVTACPLGNPPFLTRLDAQVNKTVQVLDLSENEVGDKGTIALAEALKVSFVLFRECSAFSWLPPSVTHRFDPFGCSGQQDGAKALVVGQQHR